MLINFTVGNFRSFRDSKTLNMEATSIKDLNGYVKNRGRLKLLPSAVIYGANSSGKSNFIKALSSFCEIVKTSSKLNSTENLPVSPFLLSEETEKAPTFFEIELLIGDDTFRYGFKADVNQVYEEWLFSKINAKGGEKCLFVRTPEGIGATKYFLEGANLEDKTRNNALFLAVVDSFNGPISQKIIKAISGIWIISGIKHDLLYRMVETTCNEIANFHDVLESLFSGLNMGFNKFEIPENPEIIQQIKAYTYHNKYNSEMQIIDQVRFNMAQNESAGTNKIYDLATVILCAQALGKVLVIDELDSKLHPILTREIVRLFNESKESFDGQLLFATHDTNLLSNKIFRRDQIWFTEKDAGEGTDLYSLAEFKEPDGTKIRNDRSYEKDYINGRYGGIPYIKN